MSDVGHLFMCLLAIRMSSLEKRWVIFKYLLILISNIIHSDENRLCMVSIPLDYEIFAPCFMSLDMFQGLLGYTLRELEQNLYPTGV